MKSKTLMLSVIIVIVLILILTALFMLTNTNNDAPRFVISVVPNSDYDFTMFSNEDLGGNYPNGITYVGLEAVNIHIGNRTLPLHEAISKGLVTVDEIIAQAHIDSRTPDVCKLSFNTRYGVSVFIYQYDTFDMIVRYDILDAPNGEQYLLEDFLLTNRGNGSHVSLGYDYRDENGNLISLLTENWGLDFQVNNVTSSDVQLEYTQTGGNHIGDLAISYFAIYQITDDNWTLVADTDFDTFADITLEQEGTYKLSIDWSEYCGELASGNYCLGISVADIYDQSMLHEYQEKYQDYQTHYVYFTIS